MKRKLLLTFIVLIAFSFRSANRADNVRQFPEWDYSVDARTFVDAIKMEKDKEKRAVWKSQTDLETALIEAKSK